MEKKFTQEDIMKMLDSLYEKTVQGLPVVSPSIGTLADSYLMRNNDVESAAKSFINYQITKCTTSGFLTGLGGIITLPIAIPANVSSVLYVQMRMIAGLAYMGGYDLNSDQVQTLVYACLAGVSINQVVKKAGINFGMKFGKAAVGKIPGTVLTKINQKVGFRFITKGGKTGIVNLGKMVPGLGGVISGGFDLIETKLIAKRSYRLFIEGDLADPLSSDGSDTLDESPEAPFEHYCTRCGAMLELQEGFSPELQSWYCKECGQFLFSEDIKKGRKCPNVVWFCDQCGDLLNNQEGFDDSGTTWTCTKCGHVNPFNLTLEFRNPCWPNAPKDESSSPSE